MTSPAAGLPQRATGFAHVTRSPWVIGPLLGIALGLPIFGIGGRVAMRAIAHATNVAPAFSLGGTMTVVFLGAVTGAAGGLIYAVVARLLPNRAVVRSVIFGVVLVLLTLRGLDPANSLSVSLFMPLTLLYGALMDYAYRRRFPFTARAAANERK